MVTYQAQGTLGRQIYDGAKFVEILDQKIAVNAKIKSISGYSAHADQRFLMKWLGNFQKLCYPSGIKENLEGLKKVFVVQGEGKSSLALASFIRDELGVAAKAPSIGEMAILK